MGHTFKDDLVNGIPWGPIIGHCSIGDYQFIEYREKDFSCGPNHGEETGFICWAIYVNEKSIARSTYTLDRAIAQAMAYKYLGFNSQAGELFMKMLAP